MTVLPRSSVANFFIPSPASARARCGTAAAGSHPFVRQTSDARYMNVPPRCGSAPRRRPVFRRRRRHHTDALQIGKAGPDDSENDGDEDEPPSKARSPRNLGGAGVCVPPEPADRERAEVGRGGSGNREDWIEDGEEPDPDNEEGRQEEAQGRHRPSNLEREHREDDGRQEKERDIDGVREAEDPGDRREGEGAVWEDRRPRPDAALEPLRGYRRPRERADVLRVAREDAQGPDREREGK